MNPFHYQGPVEPGDLIDRAAELHALQRAAADRVDIRLAAPRRFGKSSLLEAHMAAMRAVGHRAVRVDFYGVATITDVAARVMTAYRRLPADPGRLLDRLTQQLGLTVGPAGLTVQLGPRPGGGLGADQARQILLEVLDLPGRLHAADQGLTVVCFDEFQDLLTADDRLDGLVRSVIQHHGRAAAYVYAGSRPSLMREMFSDHERPFYAQARPLTLPVLPAGETVADLEAVFTAHDLSPGPALLQIVALAAGHPQRTMLLAHLLFGLLDDGTPPDDDGRLAAEALRLALEETADVHQAVWESLDRAGRAVVVALADGLAPTGQRTAREHAITRSSMQRALERLATDEQHVVRDDQGARLLDPLFAEWLRRR
ncbi:MAG: hypothetical protein JWP18_214 [Solirubrobacterales bacterium]|nr:hypothetical protein [Solirubrobacterales bacterium]